MVESELRGRVDRLLADHPPASTDRLDFLQMRARYRVTGRAGGTIVDFSGMGSAETFRGRYTAK